MTVWNRLYKEREVRDTLAETIQSLKARVEESCTFDPCIDGEAARLTPRDPKRALLCRGQSRRVEKLREYESSSIPEFRPHVLNRSAALVRNIRMDGRTVFDRLYSQAKCSSLSSSRTANATSESTTRFFGSPTEFLSRQDEYRQAKARRDDIRRKMEYKECSFTPRISSRSEELAAQTRPSTDVTYRLAVDDLHRRVNLAEERIRQADAACPFVPQIDSFSDAIATIRKVFDNDPVHERLFRPSRMHARSSGSSFSQDPQSAPSTARRRKKSAYSYVKSNYDLRNPALTQSVIDRARREKEYKIQCVRDEREMQEIAECSFQPNINQTRGYVPEAVLIPGLDRFLRSQERARHLTEQNRPVVLRDFDAVSDHDGRITIPEPFSFATDMKG